MINRFLTNIFIIAIFVLCSVFACDVVGAAEQYDFYYFYPDSSQSNLNKLKHEFEIFLEDANFNASFQPFVHVTDLESAIKKKKPSFLFIPYWYLEKAGNSLGLHPILSISNGGRKTYKKILLVSKQSNISLSTLEYHSVAMTQLGPQSAQILNSVLFNNHTVDARNLNIIPVPKDSDALFALALGQVDAALVSETNMQLIKGINPRLLNNVRPLLESKDLPLPVLCYAKGAVSEDDLEQFMKIFTIKENIKIRKKIMEMLKIDEWQRISK